MKPEVLPDYNSSYTNTSNIENGLFSQPELDQQLKNIISLIQVGLIDPKENPIIIGSPKDDDSDKPAKLSVCDKLKIIGILVFLIIVTVVVTLCIIYMFVPFFSRKNRTPFSISLKKSLTISQTCESLDVQSEIFHSYFGLLQISDKKSNQSKECLGLKIHPDKLVTSKNCLSEFDVDLIFEKASENYSFSVLLGLRNYSQTIQALGKHKVVNVLPFNLLLNSEMIEVDFSEGIDDRNSCLKNSTIADWESEALMYVKALKVNDTISLEKNFKKNNCPDFDSKNHTILNSMLAFVQNSEKKYQFVGIYEKFN